MRYDYMKITIATLILGVTIGVATGKTVKKSECVGHCDHLDYWCEDGAGSCFVCDELVTGKKEWYARACPKNRHKSWSW